MSPVATLPSSLDLIHHLTPRARMAPASAMKEFGRLLADQSLLSLGGGLPHKSLFPVSNINFTIPTAGSLEAVDVAGWVEGTSDTKTFDLHKDGPGLFANGPSGILDLSEVMQYGLSNGFHVLVKQLEELTYLVHGKPYKDLSIYITLGCTDAVSKTFMLFCEPGDRVLCEEFAFSSSLSSGRAKGIEFVPVKMDEHGLIPEDLDRILSQWDVTLQGKKPRILYTVPCGQNPTGTVQPADRYEEIYALSQKHDIIIMEDDPYFPLQYKDYEADAFVREELLRNSRAAMQAVPTGGEHEDLQAIARVYNDYADIRSYLSRDVDGRVVRLDTFSKVAGPGLRLGWISCNSVFQDRFLRLGETTTQVPCNISQAMMASYLSPENWGLGGWLRWCFAVRLEYQRKRDFFLDNLGSNIGHELVSTTPAGGGMFQWLRVHIEKHPRYRRYDVENCAVVKTQHLDDQTTLEPALSNTAELLQELFDVLLKDRVLVLPGRIFAVGRAGANLADKTPFFRATFAGNEEGIEKALVQFGKTVKAFFEDDQGGTRDY